MITLHTAGYVHAFCGISFSMGYETERDTQLKNIQR